MPYDRTLIANMACSHLGIGLSISDVDNESSAEADACRTFIDHVFEAVLEICPWPFATRQIALQDLGIENTAYEDQWLYAYMYPNNCKRVNKIINPAKRTPVREEDKIPYRIVSYVDSGGSDAGKLILCDQEDAILEYNHLVIEPERFSSSFAHVTSLFLAKLTGARLRAAADMIANVNREWDLWLSEATSQSKEEEQPDPDPISTFQSARS